MSSLDSGARAADLEQALGRVREAVQAGDLARASDLASGALGRGLEHPVFLNLRAMKREEAGRLGDALADLERARVLAPDDHSILNALGLCLGRLERMGEAAMAFDQTVRLAPEFAPGWLNLGWAMEALGQPKAAGQAYERAALLKSDYAEPRGKLALLAARRGDARTARELAQEALSLLPGQTWAAMALAMADIGDGAFAAAEQGLRAVLAAPNLAPADRASAQSLLGDALDAQDRTAEAFAAYEAGNAVLVQAYRDRFAAAGLPAYMTMLADYFRRSDPAEWRRPARAAPEGPAAHVFVLGFQRSGTTLVQEILAGHPRVEILQEHDQALAGATSMFMNGPDGLDRLKGATDNALSPHRLAYWQAVYDSGAAPDGRTLVDKMPLNTIKLPLIDRLFPSARVVLVRRDPRDVVLSCFRRQFRMNPSNFEFLSLEGAARYYDQVMTLAGLYLDRLSTPVHVLRYEDLVVDLDGEGAALCGFLGLEWDEKMRDFAGRAREGLVRTASSAQIARGLYLEGVDQWRRYRAELEPVLPLLQPWVERFGYPAA